LTDEFTVDNTGDGRDMVSTNFAAAGSVTDPVRQRRAE
jgi:hypothetical protein